MARTDKAAQPASSAPSGLAALVGSGAFIDEGVKNETVTWTKEDGSVVEFGVFVKAEMSAADYEFIYLGIGDSAPEPSFMARRVSRLVRLADGQSISLQDAYRLKRSLLGAICDVINRVEVLEPPPKA